MRSMIVCTSMLLTASLCLGSQSVASLTSGGVIALSGTRIEAGTVPSWPLVLGDEITTFDSSAVIVLADKSRVLLAKNSTVKIGVQNGRTVLNMMKGDALGMRSNRAPLVFSQGKRVDLVSAASFQHANTGLESSEPQQKQNHDQLPGPPTKPPVLSAYKP